MGDNNFTLTQDQTGTVYTLTGNTADLKSHVGHEVSISGQAVSGNAASANTSSGAPEQLNRIERHRKCRRQYSSGEQRPDDL